ncbi:MAG TPA: universal stress protein [Acidimicrobiales bacterium]|nr:universal stress protein [Acidimicrobiales bacterium]
MSAPKHFLVALDDLPPSSLALTVAAALAHRSGATLAGVVVNSPNSDHGRDEFEMRAQAERAGVTLEYTRVVGSDDVATSLLAAGELDAATLVLGAHARGPLGRVLIGSVGAEVLERATEPVLIVGPNAKPPEQFPFVIVCLDGSATARRALAPARDWAEALGAELRTVTVPEGADPADAIANVAGDTRAALIVATTHGLGGLAAIGSTCAAIVREAPCAALLLGPEVPA